MGDGDELRYASKSTLSIDCFHTRYLPTVTSIEFHSNAAIQNTISRPVIIFNKDVLFITTTSLLATYSYGLSTVCVEAHECAGEWRYSLRTQSVIIMTHSIQYIFVDR